MLLKIRRPWDVRASDTTPEAHAFDRRRFLETAGTLGLGGAAGLMGCRKASAHEPAIAPSPPPPEIARLYPAGRNAAFALDRPLTDEKTFTSYNNYYEFGDGKEDPARNAHRLTTRPWAIEITGLVEKPFTIDRDELVRKIGLEERLYRLRCVEAWSMAIPWTGFPLRKLVALAKPLSAAAFLRVVSFKRPKEALAQLKPWYPWPYFEAYRIEETTNDLAFVAVGAYGKELAKQNGLPLRLVMPWKYGYKSAKGVVKIDFTDRQPATFWNALQPLEYGFLSNVNPQVPHPRWSQASERFFGPRGMQFRATQPYNGYADLVAGMYSEDSRRRPS